MKTLRARRRLIPGATGGPSRPARSITALRNAEMVAWEAFEKADDAAKRAWKTYYAIEKRLAAAEKRNIVAFVRALPELSRHRWMKQLEALTAEMPEIREKIEQFKREVRT